MVKPTSPATPQSRFKELLRGVLARHLSASETEYALTLWEAKFEEATQLTDLIRFFEGLRTAVRLDQGRKNQLIMSAYYELRRVQRDETAARSKTGEWPMRQPTPNPAASAASNISYRMLDRSQYPKPEQEVFKRFCEQLIEGAQRFGFREFGEFTTALRLQLQELALNETLADNLVDWTCHRSQLLTSGLPINQLGAIVHRYYIALCEALGPVSADAILARALTASDEWPEARLCSPRQWL